MVASAKSTNNVGLTLAQLMHEFQAEVRVGKALNLASGMFRIPCTLGQERDLNNNCVNVKTLQSKGKRPPTGFNVFTRELSKLENIDKSKLMRSASTIWAAMADAEKDRYKAKAAAAGKRKAVANVCPEGKEMNDATGMCRLTCAEGKTRNFKGNCVNGNGLNEVLNAVRKMDGVPKSDVMAIALGMWNEMSPAARASYANNAFSDAKKPRKVVCVGDKCMLVD